MINQAIILAGGSGSRLRNIQKKPKPLIVFNDRSHITYLINQIYLNGFIEVFILIKADQTDLYKKEIGKLCIEVKNGLKIIIIEEQFKMGTGGWVTNNLDLLDDKFAVFNADTFFFENISSLIFKNKQHNKNIILCKEISQRNDAGSLIVDKNNLVTSFLEKKYRDKSLESVGIYFLNKKSILEFSKTKNKNQISFENDIFPFLVLKKDLYAFKVIKFSYDYGTEQRLLTAEEKLKNNKIKWLFLDRDNTLNYDKSYTYLIKDLRLIKKICPLIKGYQEDGYHISVITNQSGINRGYYSYDQMSLFNKELSKLFLENNINIRLFKICPHQPIENCSCRKPKTGMLEYIDKYFGIDKTNSIFVGDSYKDIECSKKYGISSIKVNLI